jgi:ankyrin repeat protein
MYIRNIVEKNDVNSLRKLLRSNAYPTQILNECLQYACIKGYYEISRLLIKDGANVDYRDNNYSIIEYAYINGKDDIIELLLKYGVEIPNKN